jgi:putative SOS response-associated peptidase YedK
LHAVHDRAPVLLRRDRWSDWLDPSTRTPQALLAPTMPGQVLARPVSDAVGDVRANGPELTVEIVVPEQPSLF